MGRSLTLQSRGTADRGLRQSKMPEQNRDEFNANLAEIGYQDFSIYYNNGFAGNSVSTLIVIGEKIWEAFRENSDLPLTKYRYGEAFLRLVDFLQKIEKATKFRDGDGALLEIYNEWGADPQAPGQIKFTQKFRPWSDERPKNLTDIAAFSSERQKTVRQYVLTTNPNSIIYDKNPEPSKAPDWKAANPWTSFVPYSPPADVENLKAPKQEIQGIKVQFRATPYFIELLTKPGAYDYNTIRIEYMALAIRGLSKTKIKPNDARDIASRYINKYVDGDENHRDKITVPIKEMTDEIVSTQQFYNQGVDKPVDPDSDTEVTLSFFFSSYSVLNFYYEYGVSVSIDYVRQFNGELKRELNALYQLDKIDAALQKYFQTQEPSDYAEVIHCTASSRYLMVMYLEDDWQDDAAKRTSFFKAWEWATLDNEFPSGYKSFFNGISAKITEIHNLAKQNQFAEALQKNREVFEQFQQIKDELSAYEQDKQKWGSRAIFLMTLAIDLLITYLTAGFTRLIPARFGLLLNLAVPLIKQELYLKIGIIDKRDFVNIGIEAVVNTAASKIATNISAKLVEAYNIPVGRFKSIVMDTLLTNFLTAFQAEIVDSARKHKDLDDFLEDLFKNFVLAVVHEKCASIAISRARRDGLDALVNKNDPSVLAEPARPTEDRRTTRPVPDPPPAEPESPGVTKANSDVASQQQQSGSDTSVGNATVSPPVSPEGKPSPVPGADKQGITAKGTGDTGAITTKLNPQGTVLRRRGSPPRQPAKASDAVPDDSDGRINGDESDVDVSRRQLTQRGDGSVIDTRDEASPVPGEIAPPEQAKGKGNGKTTVQPKFNPQNAKWDPRMTTGKGITPRDLNRTADEFHHLIPQELLKNPQIKTLLASRNIDIDDFTVKITWGEHNATHRMEFNNDWAAFFEMNPQATRDEILDFKNAMKHEFLLDSYPETRYGITPPDPPSPPKTPDPPKQP